MTRAVPGHLINKCPNCQRSVDIAHRRCSGCNVRLFRNGDSVPWAEIAEFCYLWMNDGPMGTGWYRGNRKAHA